MLEIYTIQPLPIDMREQVVDAIGDFVAEGGTLVVVTRGRGDDEEPDELPWPMSCVTCHASRAVDCRKLISS
ncbi:MAG: hypothetical protein IPG58_17795 [Acidobacteria bacterium]|nr:hypothetical protein [Acidobacteriota bacterium]